MPTRPSSRLLACLAVFVAAFIVTHLPPSKALPAQRFDKLLHFVGFTVLGMLALWQNLTPTSLPRLNSLLWIVLVVASYAAFDEITQPLVRRDCEFLDWVADSGGAVFGVAIIYFVQRFALQKT